MLVTDHYILNSCCNVVTISNGLFPISVLKALLHASVECSHKLCVEWVAATDLEDETRDEVRYSKR